VTISALFRIVWERRGCRAAAVHALAINGLVLVPRERIELSTSPLPRVRCTPANQRKRLTIQERTKTRFPLFSQNSGRANFGNNFFPPPIIGLLGRERAWNDFGRRAI